MIPGIASAIIGGGPSRPTLMSVEEINTTSGTLTVPAGCNLVVIGICTRHNSVSATMDAATLNGTGLSTGSAWQQTSTRVGTGIYYRTNPATGAQTCTFTPSSAPASASIFAWYFVGNTSTPIGVTVTDAGSSVTTIAATLDAGTTLPVIVACAASTGNAAYTGTNLTVDNSYNTANGSFGSGSNVTEVNPGSTAYSLNCSSGGFMNITGVEIRTIGE